MLPQRGTLRRLGRSRNFKLLDYGVMGNGDSGLSAMLNMEPSRVVAAGRLSGFEGDYADSCGGLCFPGLLNLSTEVHLFATEDEASRFLAEQKAAYAGAAGKPGRYSGPVMAVELFDPAVAGVEAEGARVRSAIFNGAETVTETVVMLRSGQVVGVSSAVSLNVETHPDAQAVELARVLAKRIRSVLVAEGIR
jgi:hypothetical protein